MSLGQLKVMSAIEACRTAELGGHVARCDGCERLAVSYNSCRNRHCASARRTKVSTWLDRCASDPSALLAKGRRSANRART